MNLFPLLCKFPFDIILPLELVHMIYIILLREKSCDTILRNHKLIQGKKNALKNILDHMIYYEIIYSNTRGYFERNLFESFIIALNGEFSRTMYTVEFWQYLLQLISSRLMIMYNCFCINGHDKKKNTDYKLFLQISEIWFKLCKKHNIRLYLVWYKYFNKNQLTREILNTRKMAPIRSFKKHSFSPLVIDNFGESVLTEEAITVLKTYLY
jgi:hypothetical protein